MNALKALALCLFVSTSAQAEQISYTQAEPIFYYGESFYNTYIAEDGETVVLGENEIEALKADLLSILTSFHISEKDKYDLLVEKCPEELGEGKECYQRIRLSYKAARIQLFGKFHLGGNEEEGYFVRDVYCEKEYRKSDFSVNQAVPGPLLIPFHEVINTEHTWPKSRFNKSKSRNKQLTDLHHLFPTDHDHNGLRSNYKFAEVGEEVKKLECEGNKVGYFKLIEEIDPRPSERFYEPPNAHKGNVARALFYFSLRYDLRIDEVEEFYLRKWHKEDPIDEFEQKRNNDIFGAQKNRNPFIDFPSLVDVIKDF